MPKRVVAEDKQRKSKWPRGAADDDPVLGIPRPKREERHVIKGSLQSALEEKVSRMGLAWGYSVGVVQGKDVTSTLNALTNVLTTLMRKDP